MGRNLHLFVDETGQETRGQFFLVAIVAVPSVDLESVRQRLTELEQASGKRHRWARSTPNRRAAFLAGLSPLLESIGPVLWRSWGSGVTYQAWLAQAVASAAVSLGPYEGLTVVLDGGNWQDQEEVKRALRAAGASWKKTVGKRDGSEPILRLADSLAGFLRDRLEPDSAACRIWPDLGCHFREV